MLRILFPNIEELCRCTIYSNISMNVHVLFTYKTNSEYKYFIYYGRTNEMHYTIHSDEYKGMYVYDEERDVLVKMNRNEKYTPNTKFIYFSEIDNASFITKTEFVF